MLMPFRIGRKKLSEDTLERLRRFRGEKTAKWLATMDEQEIINYMQKHHGLLPNLDEPTKQEDVDIQDVDKTPTYEAPLANMYTPPLPGAVNEQRSTPPSGNKQVEWVEAFFAEFTRCAAQFNESNKDPELKVNVSLPEYKFEQAPWETYVPGGKLSVYKGHLSTLRWGLFIQGYGTKIEVFIVPSQELLNLTVNDIRGKDYKPFLEIESVRVGGEIHWQVENNSVSFNKLPALAKELFGDLIRVSAGKMDDSELFGDYARELKLGETVAHGYAPSEVEAESDGINLHQLASLQKCVEVQQAIDADLRVLAQQPESNDIKQLSADLRVASAAISQLVEKYRES